MLIRKHIAIFAATICLASTAMADLSLSKGWNLKGASSNISTATLNQECINTVFTYNGSGWSTYKPGSSDEIVTIKKDEGFWIYANEACTATTTTTSSDIAFKANIIHINDHHSHLDEDSLSLNFDGVSTDVAVGGFPRIVTKIKSLQSTLENPITLHAGDALQGTLYYTLFKGAADAAMMNLIDWDAFTLGNHEFDDGDSGLLTFLDALNAPVVSANVVPASGNILEGKWEPYRIVEKSGEKIGIIGIDVKQKTEESSNPSSEITFLDETETVQKYVDTLKASGVNKIILLDHYGYSNDKTLVPNISGVDVIVGGDSHTLLGNFTDVGLTSSGDYPTIAKDKDGNTVCIVHAWEYSKVIGQLEVGFDASGNVLSCVGSPILPLGDTFTQADANGDDATVNDTTKATILAKINATDYLDVVEADSDATTLLATYSEQVNTLKAQVIGEANETLEHNRIPNQAYNDSPALPLGSDIAPIVSKSFYDLSNRADACIQNAGGVRTPISSGEITMNDAYTLLPFANTLYEIEMYGSEIKDVLEDALSNIYDNGGSTGSFPYAYALRYDIDVTKAKGERISGLEIKDRTTGEWSDIDTTKLYVVVTNSYTAGGKDGYITFGTVQEERPGVDTYLDYALSFVKYVEAKTAAGEKVSKLPAEDHCIKSFKAE